VKARLFSLTAVIAAVGGDDLPLPPGAQSGDLADCPNCAGHLLRLREQNGTWSAMLAYRVSCPKCERAIVLDESAKTGDAVECCGRRYQLTFEYGAFAAEES
jgi:hypothetical protein